MKTKYLTILLLVAVVFISCGIEDNPLTAEEKYTVDTIFGNKLNDLRIYTDSLCKVERDTLFARYADSMHTVRIKEIENLLIINPAQE
ncbi:MAG: hypothetical protein WAT46_13790 [Saprospiraceae bacterium]|nr:hypothetical protein [Saprospiraceae bacterium]